MNDRNSRYIDFFFSIVGLRGAVKITYQSFYFIPTIDHLSYIISYSSLQSNALFQFFHLLCFLYSETSTFFPSINATFSHLYFVTISTPIFRCYVIWLLIFMFSHHSNYVYLRAIIFNSDHVCLSSFILGTFSATLFGCNYYYSYYVH